MRTQSNLIKNLEKWNLYCQPECDIFLKNKTGEHFEKAFTIVNRQEGNREKTINERI